MKIEKPSRRLEDRGSLPRVRCHPDHTQARDMTTVKEASQ